MRLITKKFIDRPLPSVGWVIEDVAIRRSVQAQKPLAEVVPDCPSLRQVVRIAERVFEELHRGLGDEGFNSIERINEVPAVADIRE